MKQIILVLLIACSTPSVFSQQLFFTVEEVKVKDKAPEWEFNSATPRVLNPLKEEQKQFNETLRRRFYSERNIFIEWKKWWETNDPTPPDMGRCFELYDSVIYSGNSFISLYVYCISYSVLNGSYFASANYPDSWPFSINYDLAKNKEVTLNDLYSGDFMNVLSDYCIKDLAKQISETYTPISVNNKQLRKGAGPYKKNFKVFNLTKEGLLILFSMDQVGPYLEAPFTVLVPYSYLKDYIRKGNSLENIRR
jgi:hypothetical protein